MNRPPQQMTPWGDLDPDTQLRLREAFGQDPACQAATCSMDAKIARFAAWLAQRGVLFEASDIDGRRPKSRP